MPALSKSDAWTPSTFILYADCLVKRSLPGFAAKYYEIGLKALSDRKPEWRGAVVERYLNALLDSAQFYKAKECLENIPASERSLKNWKQLATVYDHFGEIKNAIECYKFILKTEPCALEALVALVNYGCSQKEVRLLIGQDGMVATFGTAYDALQNGSHQDGFMSFQSNNNVFALSYLAQVYRKSGDVISALQTYAKIRRLEPHWLDDMDCYGLLLHDQGNLSTISRLATDLRDLSKDRPETLVCQALVCDMKGEQKDAIQYIDQALGADSRHFLAHHVKGNLLYAAQAYGEASLCYRNAYRIAKDITNYQGLVKCYLNMGKNLEATAMAKEALALLPHSPGAVCLAGIVMSANPSLYGKAREYLDKALKMDPNSLDTLYALADLLEKQNEHQKAIELLEGHLRMHHVDSIHIRLGNLYLGLGTYDQANQHFNSALTINPESPAAKKGLGDVERAINGSDEDELDQEMEELEEEPE
ncbi:Anaphase-promoting complex subunit 7 [Kappamyces sp. JEL0680]|nr:Anaphase-promoting complex subunit 7 [Kappamyces sp. JEL0680]